MIKEDYINSASFVGARGLYVPVLQACSGWEILCFGSESPRDGKDQNHMLNSASEIWGVFRDFDDDEEDAGYTVQHDIEQDTVSIILQW